MIKKKVTNAAFPCRKSSPVVRRRRIGATESWRLRAVSIRSRVFVVSVVTAVPYRRRHRHRRRPLSPLTFARTPPYRAFSPKWLCPYLYVAHMCAVERVCVRVFSSRLGSTVVCRSRRRRLHRHRPPVRRPPPPPWCPSPRSIFFHRFYFVFFFRLTRASPCVLPAITAVRHTHTPYGLLPIPRSAIFARSRCFPTCCVGRGWGHLT